MSSTDSSFSFISYNAINSLTLGKSKGRRWENNDIYVKLPWINWKRAIALLKGHFLYSNGHEEGYKLLWFYSNVHEEGYQLLWFYLNVHEEG